ncbi:MAG: hypothetical protein Q7S84_01955 [bacterium]|nr:hypothetical protein [bacterium]
MSTKYQETNLCRSAAGPQSILADVLVASVFVDTLKHPPGQGDVSI